MTEKKLFKITEEEFNEQLELQKPIPMIMTHILPPETFDNQYHINKFWLNMSKKYGFDPETMEDAPYDEGIRAFTAQAVNEE